MVLSFIVNIIIVYKYVPNKSKLLTKIVKKIKCCNVKN